MCKKEFILFHMNFISNHGFSSQEFEMNKVTCVRCRNEIYLHMVSSAAIENNECNRCFYYYNEEPEPNYYEEINWDMEADEDYFDMNVDEEPEDPACTEMYMDFPGEKIEKQLEFIKYLPKYEHETCSICLNTFGEDRNQIVRFCQSEPHLFHEKCLVNWLKRSETCPLCRQ
jgi:hypothetical protein